MQNLTGMTVRDIALEIPLSTRVFEEFKIDYCCGGRRPLSEACESASADPDVVLKRINEIADVKTDETDWFHNSTLTALIDHIEAKHHVFTRHELENIEPLMEKVVRVHGENHAELFDVQRLFAELSNDLYPHMQKEENVLFPYIRELESRRSMGLEIVRPMFGTVQNPIRMMMVEHDMAGDILRQMREISNDYKLPDGACPSYTGLYNRLADLERDLHQHIHLENNILFPRAIELEDSPLAANA